MPEKTLLSAIIVQALRDFAGVHCYCQVSERAHIRRLARDWFLSDSMAEFSFLWVAQHLNVDPIRIRRTILSLSTREFRKRFRMLHLPRSVNLKYFAPGAGPHGHRRGRPRRADLEL